MTINQANKKNIKFLSPVLTIYEYSMKNKYIKDLGKSFFFFPFLGSKCVKELRYRSLRDRPWPAVSQEWPGTLINFSLKKENSNTPVCQVSNEQVDTSL